jgi:hypothetical protein
MVDRLMRDRLTGLCLSFQTEIEERSGERERERETRSRSVWISIFRFPKRMCPRALPFDLT